MKDYKNKVKTIALLAILAPLIAYASEDWIQHDIGNYIPNTHDYDGDNYVDFQGYNASGWIFLEWYGNPTYGAFVRRTTWFGGTLSVQGTTSMNCDYVWDQFSNVHALAVDRLEVYLQLLDADAAIDIESTHSL